MYVSLTFQADGTNFRRRFWCSRRFWNRFILAAVCLVPFALIIWLRQTGDPSHQISVASETTVLTEPIDQFGLVDYATAIRQSHQSKIQDRGNAAIGLFQAAGPSIFEEPWQAEQAYDQLGIEPLPDDGDYFITLDEVIVRMATASGSSVTDRRAEILDELSFYSHRIWSPDAFPELAEWVRVNTSPLETAIAASHSSAYCGPLLIKPGAALSQHRFPLLPTVKEMTRLLAVRAMFRLHDSDVDGAWHDLRAALRLGRLLSHGYLVIEQIHSAGNFSVAASVIPELLSSPLMDREMFHTIRNDWNNLPEWGELVFVLDTTERFATLDMIQRGARFGTACWSSASIWKLEGYPEGPASHRFLNACVDWDSLLINGNRWHDRLCSVMSETVVERREARFQDFRKNLGQLCDVPWHSLPTTANVGNRMMWSLIAETDLCARDVLIDRYTFDSMVDTIFAIETHRYQYGRLPDTLDVLISGSFTCVPRDPYAHQNELKYSLQNADGYVLYSGGPCGGDDGGLTEYSDISFRIRMPTPDWLLPDASGL